MSTTVKLPIEAIKIPEVRASSKLTAELAYLAGLFDGEGCVCIERHKPSRRQTTPYNRPGIFLVNTNLNILKFFQKKVGAGHIYIHSPPGHLGRRTCWKWTAWNEKAEITLKKLYPYLVLKKRHAKHVFTLQALKRINNRVYKIPGLVELFDKIKAKVSELNSLEFKEDTD